MEKMDFQKAKNEPPNHVFTLSTNEHLGDTLLYAIRKKNYICKVTKTL